MEFIVGFIGFLIFFCNIASSASTDAEMAIADALNEEDGDELC